jgi:hypothetical protein
MGEKINTKAVMKIIMVPLGLLAVCFAGEIVLYFYASQQLKNAMQMETRQKSIFTSTQTKLNNIQGLIDDYKKFIRLHMIGDENRLDFTEWLGRIKENLDIPVLRYTIAPQQIKWEKKPEFDALAVRGSKLHVDIKLKHDIHLISFLDHMRYAQLTTSPGYLYNTSCRAIRLDKAHADDKPGGAATKVVEAVVSDGDNSLKLSASCDYWLYTVPTALPPVAPEPFGKK